MGPRLLAVVLALAGLLVAVAVGLAANSIATRSFTPGADALPSAGSLAPRAPVKVNAPKPKPVTKPKPKQPKPVTKPKPKPGTSTVITDDHGGSGKHGGSGQGGSGKHGGDD